MGIGSEMMRNAQNVGETIRGARETLGLTQATVAEQLGISRSSYINVEAGRRAISEAEAMKIAEITGLPLDAIKNAQPVIDPVKPEPKRAWMYVDEREAEWLLAWRKGDMGYFLRIVSQKIGK